MGYALVVVGSLISAYSSYRQYSSAQDSARRQTQLAQMQSAQQMRQFQLQSAMYASQAGAFGAQAGALTKQADEFLKQAKFANTTGKILQSNEMVRAAQAQREAEEEARRSAELRRQLVGGAKTMFAANGVLLESRPQSAVAMWEQDETADLATELMGIQDKRDNEVWGHVWSGNTARMQGLFDAQSLKLQSDASKIEAGAARANAATASAQSRIASIDAMIASTSWMAVREQGRANVDAARWNMYSSIGGAVASVGSYAYSKSGNNVSSASAGSNRSPMTTGKTTTGSYGDYSLLTGYK